jgi:hypothetical protein
MHTRLFYFFVTLFTLFCQKQRLTFYLLLQLEFQMLSGLVLRVITMFW